MRSRVKRNGQGRDGIHKVFTKQNILSGKWIWPLQFAPRLPRVGKEHGVSNLPWLPFSLSSCTFSTPPSLPHPWIIWTLCMCWQTSSLKDAKRERQDVAC